jgi:hypothetical protein
MHKITQPDEKYFMPILNTSKIHQVQQWLIKLLLQQKQRNQKGIPVRILSVGSAGLAFFHLLTHALFRRLCGSFTLKLLKVYVLLVYFGKMLMSAHQIGSNNPVGLHRNIDKIDPRELSVKIAGLRAEI